VSPDRRISRFYESLRDRREMPILFGGTNVLPGKLIDMDGNTAVSFPPVEEAATI
jgi:hypothetical protein